MSGHRELANPQHRAEVAALWGIDRVPEKPGKTAVDMFAALAAGDIKMIWIACTNPAQSMPDQASVRAGLRRAELVVLQEAYADTETAAFADVLLPATTWGEKDGTVTNSERRISRVRSAVPGPARRATTGESPSILRGVSKRDCSRPISRACRRSFRMLRPERYFASMPRRRAAAISTSPGSPTRCSTPAARSSGRFPQGAQQRPAAAL